MSSSSSSHMHSKTQNPRKRKQRLEIGHWGENLKRMLVEMGFGNNSYHHQATTGEPSSEASTNFPEIRVTPSRPTSSKVFFDTTTIENKGNNSNRSHIVLGKYSTDGATSDAARMSGSSLDALAKAKRLLQKGKEVSEKLKKIPVIDPSGEGTSQVRSKEGVKATSSAAGVSPTPVLPATSWGLAASSSALPASSASMNTHSSGLPNLPGLTAQKYEAVKKARELAAQFNPLIKMFPGQMPPEVTMHPKPGKALALHLDASGREVDEYGNVVDTTKPNYLSTLKVNINKQKKDAFQVLKPELEVDPEKNPFFDPNIGINKNMILRPKRITFQFVEEGNWAKDAEIVKMKNQFGEARAKELKVKQAQLAKAKAEPDINPNLIEISERVPTKAKITEDPIPEVEWWDTPFLKIGTYQDIVTGGILTDSQLKMDMITIDVEHPHPIEPPAEPAAPPPQLLKLTKKEKKKLRTQRRLANEKEKQEMIRQGLSEPPKPKVKMSNLNKVLASEATQDPTKLEMEIKGAAAEREQAHRDRNTARKLTPSERSEKKQRKLNGDLGSLETIVSVYKINDLSHGQWQYKVGKNARQNDLTGCAVISEGITVVVVEGGDKSIKRYNNLMLRRIDWAASAKDDEDDEGDEEKPINKCQLVWQGSVAKSSFTRFSVQELRTEAAARKVFSDVGVAHYWELAVNFSDDQL